MLVDRMYGVTTAIGSSAELTTLDPTRPPPVSHQDIYMDMVAALQCAPSLHARVVGTIFLARHRQHSPNQVCCKQRCMNQFVQGPMSGIYL